MSAEAAYIDSSAFVKTIVVEAESQALQRFLANCDRVVSSALLQTETVRAVTRVAPELASLVERRLDRVGLVAVGRAVLAAAGTLHPVQIRTLDAIHLATAQLFGNELAAIVTYDQRMMAAARDLGLPVQSPH